MPRGEVGESRVQGLLVTTLVFRFLKRHAKRYPWRMNSGEEAHPRRFTENPGKSPFSLEGKIVFRVSWIMGSWSWCCEKFVKSVSVSQSECRQEIFPSTLKVEEFNNNSFMLKLVRTMPT